MVQLIAAMVEPYEGTLYDPACGSGGMFIQSAELVKSKQGNLNGINIYGQEKEAATYRLAKMNLALRGIAIILVVRMILLLQMIYIKDYILITSWLIHLSI